MPDEESCDGGSHCSNEAQIDGRKLAEEKGDRQRFHSGETGGGPLPEMETKREADF